MAIVMKKGTHFFVIAKMDILETDARIKRRSIASLIHARTVGNATKKVTLTFVNARLIFMEGIAR